MNTEHPHTLTVGSTVKARGDYLATLVHLSDITPSLAFIIPLDGSGSIVTYITGKRAVGVWANINDLETL